MRIASWPLHSHMCVNRTCAFGVAGDSSVASCHETPASVLTSTRVILPRPDHASPVTGHQPRVIVEGYAGDVMMDVASISNASWRAVPLGSGSVYAAVSHRVIHGRVPSSR